MPQTTIRPVKPVTETVADITISNNNIYISFFETNDDFKTLIKDHGFSWGGFGVGYKRECDKFTGSALDRATEICILLLKAGFIISIADDILKDKILKKEFEPEQKAQDTTGYLGARRPKMKSVSGFILFMIGRLVTSGNIFPITD